MGEAIWLTINIRTPDSWGDDNNPPWIVPKLMRGVLCNGEEPYREALGYWQLTGEGNYGTADDDVINLLEWCETHRVPYIVVEDSKYEMMGSYTVYDGTTARSIDYAADSLVLCAHAYEAIRDGKHPWALTVEDYFGLAAIATESLSIDHLPAECPEEPDE